MKDFRIRDYRGTWFGALMLAIPVNAQRLGLLLEDAGVNCGATYGPCG